MNLQLLKQASYLIKVAKMMPKICTESEANALSASKRDHFDAADSASMRYGTNPDLTRASFGRRKMIQDQDKKWNMPLQDARQEYLKQQRELYDDKMSEFFEYLEYGREDPSIPVPRMPEYPKDNFDYKSFLQNRKEYFQNERPQLMQEMNNGWQYSNPAYGMPQLNYEY